MSSPDPTQCNFSEELKCLEASFHHLKLEYERYFLGQRPSEPARERAELARGLLRPGREPIRNTASRFALNGLKDRFQTFSRKWDRTQGEIEAGTYTRHRFKARLRTARPSANPPPQRNDEESLFQAYREANQACGHNPEGLTPARFKQALDQHRAQLSKKFGDAPIEFDVQIDDGRVRLRARPGPKPGS
ncbi:MAG: MXAN_5187 C-terminal domain-containing protein [Myxococcota bacterium]|nr:MXAN_5187 C-terminal domain-containing protein [Myxococcota bacterium]